MAEGYLPLYRKYRPQKLEDIVGQAHIKRALTNAIEQNKISHAYLFTGPRGTGKTSTARILAKSLNCVNGPTVEPCEVCESCKAITNTIPIDVIEMDAASNRSVDDAHEILEKVNYAPVHGKYKIYIIDEVHMLTTQAFNALLKTLEEPPKNVIFILATTESHKVLDTIKSRCQRFDFKRITTNDIIEHLKKIAKKESINITDGAISLIAKSSAGGMRDSLALLDQVSTMGSNEAITESDINNLLGRLSFDSLLELTTHITNSDGASAINTLEKIYNDGNEPIQILTNLMLFFKNILIYKTCDKSVLPDLTGLTEDQLNLLKPIKDSLDTHQIIFLINKTSDYIKELKTVTNQQVWLEVGLIDLANLTDNTRLVDLEARITRLEGGEVSQAAPSPKVVVNLKERKIEKVSNSAPVVEEVVHKEVAKEPVEKAEQAVQNDKVQPIIEDKSAESSEHIVNFDSSLDLMSTWSAIINALPIKDGGGRASIMAMASLVQCDKDGIVIAVKSPTYTEKLNAPEKKKTMVEAVHKVLGNIDVPVVIRLRKPDDIKYDKPKPTPPKKKMVPPKDLVDNEPEVSEQEIETVNQAKSENPENKGVKNDSTLSDQANMIVNLFDGKVLD